MNLFFKHLGDIFSFFNVLSGVLFQIATVKQDEWKWFDRVFYSDGFCVLNRREAFYSSHALCFYVNFFFAVVIAIGVQLNHNYIVEKNLWVFSSLMKTPETQDKKKLSLLDKVKKYSVPFSIFAHGFMHMVISLFEWFSAEFHFEEPTVSRWIGGPIFTVVFFVLLVGTLPPDVYRNSNFLLVLIALICGFVPEEWTLLTSFSSVQFVLSTVPAGLTLVFFKAEKKSYTYFIWSASLAFVNLVQWFIAISCGRFLLLGGHVWYDISVSVATIFSSSIFLLRPIVEKSKRE